MQWSKMDMFSLLWSIQQPDNTLNRPYGTEKNNFEFLVKLWMGRWASSPLPHIKSDVMQ